MHTQGTAPGHPGDGHTHDTHPKKYTKICTVIAVGGGGGGGGVFMVDCGREEATNGGIGWTCK